MPSETITTISPITGKPILTRQGIDESDFDGILSASKKAFSTFRYTHPLSKRQEIVQKVLKALSERQNELGREVTEQMGRPITYTPKEVATAVKRGEYLLKVSDEALKDTPGEPEEGFKRWIRKEPVGTVLVVFAWNYPYIILVNSLIPAILAGNTLLLKPSPQTPTVAERFLEMFTEAGLPENVIQVIHAGNFDTVKALVKRPEVNAVSFTGSVAGGIAIQNAAKDRVIPVALELGGNDPAYVRDDVDVAWAAAEIVDGAVFNSGQSCCSIERVYVHESIYDTFLKEVVKVLEGYKLGDPFDEKTHLGPVVSVQSAKNIAVHLNDAKEKGAKVLTPDVFASGVAMGPAFVRPELLADCTHQMRVMKEETFGPLIPVMKVGSDEEAIGLMNDSNLGLTASIWTKDTEKAEQLLERVEAGTVFVNRCDYPAPDLAWTGWKDSGRGVTLSKFGFEAFTKLRSWHVKAYPNK
ncbi:ALDH-like protein [Ascodesmis nigricans]|uniref:aldehyde dehydrogenase (NAD(+)) n=1 Tax=Ascodesmis nigricans TaxID=341454 RepID=A0A4S2MSP7_9PEZI|nr:ALDH-like protein [Ascodesmis nigricans]